MNQPAKCDVALENTPLSVHRGRALTDVRRSRKRHHDPHGGALRGPGAHSPTARPRGTPAPDPRALAMTEGAARRCVRPPSSKRSSRHRSRSPGPAVGSFLLLTVPLYMVSPRSANPFACRSTFGGCFLVSKAIIKLLRTFTCVFAWARTSAYPGKHREVKLLGHAVALCLPLKESATAFQNGPTTAPAEYRRCNALFLTGVGVC